MRPTRLFMARKLLPKVELRPSGAPELKRISVTLIKAGATSASKIELDGRFVKVV